MPCRTPLFTIVAFSSRKFFWKEQALQLPWFRKPENILSQTERGHFRWFEDGKTNICYLYLDRQVEEGRGEKIALIYDSPVSGKKEKYISKGLTKGDTVVIYMPMIPQAAIAMMACAGLGVIHSVVFGGFAPQELALRINDVQPKAIISASYGIVFDKK